MHVVDVTTATTADVDAVVDLWVDLASDQRAYDSHLLAGANRTAIREAVVRRVVTDDVLLARADRDVVGFAMTTVETGRYEQDVTRGLVENIYVRPAYRGRGIGSSLLDAAEAELKASGADVVALDVLADNDDARRFYRSNGYEPHRIELEKRTENDTL